MKEEKKRDIRYVSDCCRASSHLEPPSDPSRPYYVDQDWVCNKCGHGCDLIEEKTYTQSEVDQLLQEEREKVLEEVRDELMVARDRAMKFPDGGHSQFWDAMEIIGGMMSKLNKKKK